MSVMVLEKPPKSSAAGNYLGYSLQQLRACYHLFHSADADQVSLEYVDDVAVHRANGVLLLEQAKSALSSNPLTDKADDLWKTFANWATLCVDHGVDPATTAFRLYVTPAKPVADFAKLMHDAGPKEAGALLAKIETLAKGAGKPPACADQIARFLSAGPEICAAIIAAFGVETEDDPVAKLLVFSRLFVPEAAAEFASACIGLAHGSLDELARAKKPAVVSCESFRRKVRLLAARSNLENLIATPAPSSHAVQAVASDNPLFVRQLHAVDLQADDVLSAVSDYLRTAADKTFWGEAGRILQVDLDEVDEQLIRKHRLARSEIEDVHKALDERDRGRRLYRKCSDYQVKLGALTTPEHFVAGEYNHLAQARRLGWHPNYLELFPDEDA